MDRGSCHGRGREVSQLQGGPEHRSERPEGGVSEERTGLRGR